MHGDETVQVTINLTRTREGLTHWFVTTSKELQTIQWTDDGSVEDWPTAIDQAIKVAVNELRHLMMGGSVNI